MLAAFPQYYEQNPCIHVGELSWMHRVLGRGYSSHVTTARSYYKELP